MYGGGQQYLTLPVLSFVPSALILPLPELPLPELASNILILPVSSLVRPGYKASSQANPLRICILKAIKQ